MLLGRTNKHCKIRVLHLPEELVELHEIFWQLKVQAYQQFSSSTLLLNDRPSTVVLQI